MQDGYQRKTKGVLSTPAHPLKCVILRIVHRALVIQAVKQIVQLFRKRYTEDVTVVQHSTHIADLLMCIKHIINPA
jgi:PHP family Zn ribbon phosphoesterase